MPVFSAQSVERLKTCHPELQVLFNEVIKTIDCAVIEGHRDKVAQDAAFAKGNSKLRWPNGKHNSSPSMAVDVAPYPIDYKDLQRWHYFAGFVLGTALQLRQQGIMRLGVRWGGDWDGDALMNDEKFRDLFHYELRVAE